MNPLSLYSKQLTTSFVTNWMGRRRLASCRPELSTRRHLWCLFACIVRERSGSSLFLWQSLRRRTDWNPNRWGTTEQTNRPSGWKPYTRRLTISKNSIPTPFLLPSSSCVTIRRYYVYRRWTIWICWLALNSAGSRKYRCAGNSILRSTPRRTDGRLRYCPALFSDGRPKRRRCAPVWQFRFRDCRRWMISIFKWSDGGWFGKIY